MTTTQKPDAVWLTVQRGSWRCGTCKGDIGATLSGGYINVVLPKCCRQRGACKVESEMMLTEAPEGRA